MPSNRDRTDNVAPRLTPAPPTPMAQASESAATESSAPWHRDCGQWWQDEAASSQAPWCADAAERWTSWSPSSSWAVWQAPRGDRGWDAGRDDRRGDQLWATKRSGGGHG
ncbi:unnamed protein product [Prorocentrum cordatum]|uniref:Uncharacterized protein n=1 Tax=Prorocentrum cordatum TaxID=2364126 RepID=A0ABN9QFP6_9DINO|nr:unnamed protein product [Polarella glacialis]